VECIRSLGVLLDSHLRLDRHINMVSKTCYYQLRQLKTLCKLMGRDTLRSVLQAFLSTKLDYCNALYSGLPVQRLVQLQRVQNSAARLYSGTRKTDHISPVLQDLHWLPIQYRICYKMAIIAYKIRHALAPSYLVDLCPQSGDLQLRSLRSVSHGDFATVRTATHQYGDRTLSKSVATVWNSLPSALRDLPTALSYSRRLKTYYFKQAYCG
jgi:hypothetical protein